MFGRLSFLQIYSGSLLSFSIFQAAAAVSDFDDTAADGVGAAFEKKAKRARLRLEQAEPAPDVGNEGAAMQPAAAAAAPSRPVATLLRKKSTAALPAPAAVAAPPPPSVALHLPPTTSSISSSGNKPNVIETPRLAELFAPLQVLPGTKRGTAFAATSPKRGASTAAPGKSKSPATRAHSTRPNPIQTDEGATSQDLVSLQQLANGRKRFRLCYLDTENTGFESAPRRVFQGEKGSTRLPYEVAEPDFLLEIAVRVIEVNIETGKVVELSRKQVGGRGSSSSSSGTGSTSAAASSTTRDSDFTRAFRQWREENNIAHTFEFKLPSPKVAAATPAASTGTTGRTRTAGTLQSFFPNSSPSPLQQHEVEQHEALRERNRQYLQELLSKRVETDAKVSYLGLEEPDAVRFANKFGSWDEYEQIPSGAFSVNKVGLVDKVIVKEINAAEGIVEEIPIRGVKGKKIDWDWIGQLMEMSDFVVAHNADYDFKFVAREFPPSKHKPWLCSVRDVPWQDLLEKWMRGGGGGGGKDAISAPIVVPKLVNVKAETLSAAFHVEAGQHDALSDITACIEVLEKASGFVPLIKNGLLRLKFGRFYEIGLTHNHVRKLGQGGAGAQAMLPPVVGVDGDGVVAATSGVTKSGGAMHPILRQTSTWWQKFEEQRSVGQANNQNNFKPIFLRAPGPKPWERHVAEWLSPAEKERWLFEAMRLFEAEHFSARYIPPALEAGEADLAGEKEVVEHNMSSTEVVGVPGGAAGASTSTTKEKESKQGGVLLVSRYMSEAEAPSVMQRFYELWYKAPFFKVAGRPQRGHFWYDQFFPVFSQRLFAGSGDFFDGL